MTIYLIKWIDRDDNTHSQFAASSYDTARKRLRELNDDPQIYVYPNEEGHPIHTLKPKNQKDVIELINSL